MKIYIGDDGILIGDRRIFWREIFRFELLGGGVLVNDEVIEGEIIWVD